MPIYSVEYNPKTKEYKVDTWSDMLDRNHAAALKGELTGWTLLSIAVSEKEGYGIAEKHMELLNRSVVEFIED